MKNKTKERSRTLASTLTLKEGPVDDMEGFGKGGGGGGASSLGGVTNKNKEEENIKALENKAASAKADSSIKSADAAREYAKSGPKFNDPGEMFNNAIKGRHLSDNPKDANYAGKYMYMGTTPEGHQFKHIETRKYMNVPNTTWPPKK